MTNLEKKFERVVEKIHNRYSFLEGVEIDVSEGYGLKGATKYDPKQNSISIDLKEIRTFYNTPRFVKRLGKVRTFGGLVLLVLLHEIAHVQQFQTIPDHRLNAAIGESDYDTISGHDECWVEKEADKWARRERKKLGRISV